MLGIFHSIGKSNYHFVCKTKSLRPKCVSTHCTLKCFRVSRMALGSRGSLAGYANNTVFGVWVVSRDIGHPFWTTTIQKHNRLLVPCVHETKGLNKLLQNGDGYVLLFSIDE